MKVVEGGKKNGQSEYKRLSNYVIRMVPTPDGKEVEKKFGKRADQVTFELMKHTNNYPKRVGSRLFVIGDKNEIIWIDSAPKLFAEISGRFKIELGWGQAEGAVSKHELFEFLRGKAERFEMVATMPHQPEREEIFYALPPRDQRSFA